MRTLPFLAVLLAAPAFAKPPLTAAGGLRTTVSAFNQGDWSRVGTGTGGQLRLQLGDRVGSEWFYDYVSNDLPGAARRVDDHIGWSILFYPTRTRDYRTVAVPYLAAGHCFDYTRITTAHDAAGRWSSAVQLGAGTHFNLTERVDVSPTAQYMIHLGEDLHYDGHDVHSSHAGTLEGHLLFNLSVNYRFKMPKA